MTTTTPVLQIKDLRVSFPTESGLVQAVRGVDIDVYSGELVGIVGESGSGKSVTFLATMGLLPKTAQITGSVKIAGEEILGSKPREMRAVRGQKIAMIFQDPLSALNPTHRVGQQVAEMILAHNDMAHDEAMEKAIALLELVGIPQPGRRSRRYPHEFSGGMRQRVMIAMAVANNPKVLIADEPTTALDVTVQAQILEVIQNVQRAVGAAVVFITHDLGVIARVADRVQVMYAGRTVERGPVDDIILRPTHPYTQGLIHSIPSLGNQRLTPIPGAPPNMLRPPSGCAFRVRCPFAKAVCGEQLPELRSIGAIETACVRADELLAGVNA